MIFECCRLTNNWNLCGIWFFPFTWRLLLFLPSKCLKKSQMSWVYFSKSLLLRCWWLFSSIFGRSWNAFWAIFLFHFKIIINFRIAWMWLCDPWAFYQKLTQIRRDFYWKPQFHESHRISIRFIHFQLRVCDNENFQVPRV